MHSNSRHSLRAICFSFFHFGEKNIRLCGDRLKRKQNAHKLLSTIAFGVPQFCRLKIDRSIEGGIPRAHGEKGDYDEDHFIGNATRTRLTSSTQIRLR